MRPVQLSAVIARAVAEIGTLVDTRFVEPKAWRSTLEGLRGRDDVDTIIVGGGDGSVSTAGTVFVGSGKAMGVIRSGRSTCSPAPCGYRPPWTRPSRRCRNAA